MLLYFFEDSAFDVVFEGVNQTFVDINMPVYELQGKQWP